MRNANKRTQRILPGFVLLSFAASLCLLFGQDRPREKRQETDLRAALKKAAEYCEKLESVALNFVCLEKLEEKIYNPYLTVGLRSFRSYRRELNRYEYDYQLIRKDGRTTERRILLKENGKEKREYDARLKTKRFDYKYVIFGPLGLLSKTWQQHHDYAIIGKETIGRARTMIIEATPKEPGLVEHLNGKIWVNEEDFSIIRIEWNQASMGNFKGVEGMAKQLEATPQIQLISEYQFEKNGIRFPSQYTVKENYKTGPRILTKSALAVTYESYKFFTVETEIKY